MEVFKIGRPKLHVGAVDRFKAAKIEIQEMIVEHENKIARLRELLGNKFLTPGAIAALADRTKAKKGE